MQDSELDLDVKTSKTGFSKYVEQLYNFHI